MVVRNIGLSCEKWQHDAKLKAVEPPPVPVKVTLSPQSGSCPFLVFFVVCFHCSPLALLSEQGLIELTAPPCCSVVKEPGT